MARLTLQDTMDRLLLLIRAGYPVIYIISHEEARVLDYLVKIFRVLKSDHPNKSFLRWYDGIGLQDISPQSIRPYTEDRERIDWLRMEGLPKTAVWNKRGYDGAAEALSAIKSAQIEARAALADSITVFFDLHQRLRQDAGFIAGDSLVRPLRTAADELRRHYDVNRTVTGQPYKTIIIVAPSAVGLSMELERDVLIMEFPLPDRDELLFTLEDMIKRNILRFADDNSEQQQDGPDRSRLCDLLAAAGRGLTLEVFKLGLNMISIRERPLCASDVEQILDLKAKAINNQALQYTPHVDIELGGLTGAKEWIRMRRDPAISQEIRAKYHLPPPKGTLLCGVSGGGKSQLAKLIAKEFNLALLRLDVGALFGMYVGESEEKTRVALQLAEILAPVVLWLDEVDKAFTGVGSAGDNGVSARVFGHFLTWLSEKQDSVFVVATANDHRKLLVQFPEFGRKGRFDEIFWVDLPDQLARQAIFKIYIEPLYIQGYFRVTDQEIQQLIERFNIQETVGSGDDLSRFCWVLSHRNLSQNMTGAEIEYAINESLYGAYNKSVGLTPEMIAEIVEKAKDRALYKDGSPDAHTLTELRNDMAYRNWMIAG